jgi:glycosyltransferase involved in cell wall biosynthesis
MVRVLFLASPFKARMILRMTDEFSHEITYKILTMAYPYTRVVAGTKSPKEKMFDQLLGDRGLPEMISNFRPDVVYSDSPLYGAQFKLVSYLNHYRKPLVLHLRGDWWREHSASFFTSHWKKRVLTTPSYSYKWASVLLASKVTPICRWLERVVKHNVPRKRTEVVYQGVDPGQFYAEDGLKLTKPAVAIIQNHTVYSKVVGLLKFKRVAERLPKIHFYIAEGENVEQTFLPVVKKHFNDLPNVHFVAGVNTTSDVRKMLTAADCYVLASDLDCCPTTVLEASLMRKPVVASRIGGVPETILENETGWTVRNELKDEWIQKIESAVTDTRLNRRLGNKGREWVSSKFAWKPIANQVEKLLISEASR